MGCTYSKSTHITYFMFRLGEGSRSRNRATIIISVISAGSGKKEFRWDQSGIKIKDDNTEETNCEDEDKTMIRDNSYKIIGIQSSEERGRGEAQILLKHIIHAKVPVHQMMR